MQYTTFIIFANFENVENIFVQRDGMMADDGWRGHDGNEGKGRLQIFRILTK